MNPLLLLSEMRTYTHGKDTHYIYLDCGLRC